MVQRILGQPVGSWRRRAARERRYPSGIFSARPAARHQRREELHQRIPRSRTFRAPPRHTLVRFPIRCASTLQTCCRERTSGKLGISTFLERESIGPVDIGLVWRGLRVDELTDGIADVTKLGTGVVPDHVPESMALTIHLGVQHFFDGNGSIGEANESARTDGAIGSVRQPESAADAGQVFRRPNALAQRTAGALREVRQAASDDNLLRASQELFERCDFGTGRIDESGRRLTSQALSMEQHADERQRSKTDIGMCACEVSCASRHRGTIRI